MNKIDIHAHYGPWPFAGRNFGIDDIVEVGRKYDIKAFFLSSSKAILYDFVEGNRELFDMISGIDGLYGYVTVNSNYPEESIREIAKYADNSKFIGVKYHPAYCKREADCDEMMSVLAVVDKLDVPLLVHTFGEGISSPLHLLGINKKFPGLKLIAAHMGGNRTDLGCRLVQLSNENVFLEICSTYMDYGKIRNAIDVAGRGHVLFGTDFALFDPSYTIGAVESSELTEDEKKMLYHENAARIFTRYHNNEFMQTIN